jgi:hypothetical protein
MIKSMPTKKVETEVSPEVKLWKENKIEECQMEFSCGGDSMNDYSFNFFNKKGKEVICEELKDYFDNKVFSRVEFYEASDGHYIGEFGVVHITLNDDEDDFEYQKSSKSEWSERYSEDIPIGITTEEAKFIKEKVGNMNGGDGDKNINYKIDCILTDDEEEMVDKLLNRIDDACSEHEFENEQGEPDDFYTWSTNEDGDEIQIKGDNLYVSVSRSFMITKEEDY